LTAVLLGCAGPAFPPGLAGEPDRIILNLTEDPATSTAVTWRTRSPADPSMGQITRATEFTDLEKNATIVHGTTEEVSLDDGETAYHHGLVFRSLKPDTLYAYRVGNGTQWSEWNQFRTANESPEPFTFINIGDPQNDIRSRCARLFRMAYRTAPDADFWHFTGDLVNNSANDSEWAELFCALGWIPRTTPCLLLPGNHGYLLEKDGDRVIRHLSPLWKPHFLLPENGPPGLEETAYYVDYQGVRFVMLNGNEKLDAQAEWLGRVLAQNPQRWTIAAVHQPLYSTAKDRDNPGLRKLFLPLFDRYAVDLVLQGHDHTYGRTYKLHNGTRVADTEEGTVYVVSVSGPKVYDLNEQTRDIMAKSGNRRQLFQVITVEKDRLRYESFDALGNLYDAFELTK
jgi:3',5'-cyclic AMP phosphodiesterase CpdA